MEIFVEPSGFGKPGRDHSLLVFLHQLVARHSTASITLSRDGNEDSAVQRSKKFLDEHYAERVSLQELARLAGLSPLSSAEIASANN
jgi:hypothetical protein